MGKSEDKRNDDLKLTGHKNEKDSWERGGKKLRKRRSTFAFLYDCYKLDDTRKLESFSGFALNL